MRSYDTPPDLSPAQIVSVEGAFSNIPTLLSFAAAGVTQLQALHAQAVRRGMLKKRLMCPLDLRQQVARASWWRIASSC